MLCQRVGVACMDITFFYSSLRDSPAAFRRMLQGTPSNVKGFRRALLDCRQPGQVMDQLRKICQFYQNPMRVIVSTLEQIVFSTEKMRSCGDG
jgi:hypothetical protein